MSDTACTPELCTEILLRLTEGETLREICRTAGMPSDRTVRRWALDDVAGFGARYARAREIGYLAMADEIIELCDNKDGDFYLDDEGRRRPDHAAVHRSRLHVDTRKWLLAKCLPKIYGDKQTHELEAGDKLADLIRMAAKLDE